MRFQFHIDFPCVAAWLAVEVTDAGRELGPECWVWLRRVPLEAKWLGRQEIQVFLCGQGNDFMSCHPVSGVYGSAG